MIFAGRSSVVGEMSRNEETSSSSRRRRLTDDPAPGCGGWKKPRPPTHHVSHLTTGRAAAAIRNVEKRLNRKREGRKAVDGLAELRPEEGEEGESQSVSREGRDGAAVVSTTVSDR